MSERVQLPQAQGGTIPRLTLELFADGRATCTMRGAGALGNLFDAGLCRELEAALREIESSRAIMAVVLIAAPPGDFAHGPAAPELLGLASEHDAATLREPLVRVISRLRASPKPIVAAIDGAANGVGFELALACHARVATARSSLSLADSATGYLPGFHGLQELAATIGVREAARIALTGARLSADEAHASGLLTRIASGADLASCAAHIALDLGQAKPRSTTPTPSRRDRLVGGLTIKRLRAHTLASPLCHDVAQRRVLDVLEAFVARGFAASAEIERHAFAELAIASSTRRSVEHLAELAKARGAPAAIAYDRGARVPLLVLGTGADAAAVAQSFASRPRRIVPELDGATPVAAGPRWVIAAGRDNLDEKRKALEPVWKSAAPRVGVTSTTLALGLLAPGRDEAGALVGFTFHAPLVSGDSPLLELTLCAETQPEVARDAAALGHENGFSVVALRDGIGRFSARLITAYVSEAFDLMAEGASGLAIDAALEDWGFTLGPMRLAERIGRAEVERWRDAFAHSVGQRFAAAPRKRTRPASREELQARCSLRLVNEAHHCASEGMVTDPHSADLVAVMAVGFPRFRGGPFQYARDLGGELTSRLLTLARRATRFAPAQSLPAPGEADGVSPSSST